MARDMPMEESSGRGPEARDQQNERSGGLNPVNSNMLGRKGHLGMRLHPTNVQHAAYHSYVFIPVSLPTIPRMLCERPRCIKGSCGVYYGGNTYPDETEAFWETLTKY